MGTTILKKVGRPRKYIQIKRGYLMGHGKLVVLVTNPVGNAYQGFRCFGGVVLIEDVLTPEFPRGMYSGTWDWEAFKKIDCKIRLMPT